MAEMKKQNKATPSKQGPPPVPSKGIKTSPAAVKHVPIAAPFFSKDNYTWMIIGGVVIILGMFLMSGGKNEDPNKFDYNVVYSTTRITIAPILIILGLLIEVYAIFKKQKVNQ